MYIKKQSSFGIYPLGAQHNMFNMARIVCMASLLILTACATPLGQLKEDDFTWTRKKDIPLNYQAVYRNTKNLFSSCDYQFFVDGNIYSDVQEAHLDIYLGTMTGGKTDWVWGIARIKAIDDSNTSLSVGIVSKYAKKVLDSGETRGEAITRWAMGDKVCP